MLRPSGQAKAELIQFWCRRAAEGRSKSAAKGRVTVVAALRSVIALISYAVRPRHADILIIAHPDRGADALQDVPYVGKLAHRIRQRHRVVFLQMRPLKAVHNVVSCPWLALRVLEQLAGILRPALSKEDTDLCVMIADRFKICEASVKARIRRLNFELGQWRALLERHQPRAVVLVDGYSSNAALIWTARRMGITTIEVQHGACGASHVGYRMIGSSNEPLWPDYFLAWDSFWRERMTEVPGYDARIKVCSATAQSWTTRGLSPDWPQSALLIHQPSLSQVVFDLLSQLPDRTDLSSIAVKYHPGIQPDWEARLDALCVQKGITVIRNRQLEDVVAEFGTIVGWFSTVLYQAAEAGCVVRYLPRRDLEVQQAPLAQRGIPILTEAAFLKIGGA